MAVQLKYTSCFALLILFLTVGISNAQTRYRDSIFGDIRMRTFNYADTLQLDLYDVAKDTVSQKPLIILVHGGGFAAGQRNGGEETTFCKNFAKLGYAVASISYRLTMKNRNFGCECAVTDKLEAYTNGVDDLKKAKYFLTNYAKDFNIDPHQIILAGSSSGAETVLNATIMNDNYLFRRVDRDEGKVVGIISMSGATLESHYLTANNKVPMLFFHGKLDDKVPFGIGSHHTCNPNSKGYLMLDGPLPISERLKALDTSYEIYYYSNGAHECAELAYANFKTMADFLYAVVLNGEFRQEIREIEEPIKK